MTPQTDELYAGGMEQQPGEMDEVIGLLRSLDEDDLELTAPPASVWDGIEASIESGRAELPASPSADGAVAVIVDASGTMNLTHALLEQGFEDEEVRMIMGGNVIRVLGQLLPGGGGA